MLLTLTTSHHPATDLGFLLHKHPERVQSFEVFGGSAHVFYPRADERECTAAVLLEIDPIELVRGRHTAAAQAFSLGRYVNDRPYAASSLLAVAMGSVFRTALRGRCDAKPELANTAIPLRIELPALPCRDGAELITRLFAPLGWQVAVTPVPLDEQAPEQGGSRYFGLVLTGEQVLADALNHLYVLLPVLDDAKHYWVGEDEIGKLLRAGGSWLAGHPERELISARYLAHRDSYLRSALARLAESEDARPEELDNALAPARADDPVAPLALRRRAAVLAALRAEGAHTVADLGCGSGALLADLLAAPEFTGILGVDVSDRALRAAHRRLDLDRLAERVRSRITLRRSALTYADDSLAGHQAAVLMEVVEHVDPIRLPALEHAVFDVARPRSVVVTTPNAEYNVRFRDLPAGRFRHPDHRFEWGRAEFADWAGRVAAGHGYTVRFEPVGEIDPDLGPQTQLAVFRRADNADRGTDTQEEGR